MINTTWKLYDKLLNRYKIQYDKLSEDSKKRVDVLNKPEMLALDFDEDHLSPIEADEEVKSEPEETFWKNKIKSSKEKNNRNRVKSFHLKQIINQTYNIISTNKSWKQFIQIKKWNQTNMYLLYQHNKITKKVWRK